MLILRIACFLGALAMPFIGLSVNCQPSSYIGAEGPYQVAFKRYVVLDTTNRPEPLIVQITHPVGAGRTPVIVFSHGFRCTWEGDDALTGYWAQNGYTVIQPRHLDSEPNSKAEIYAQEVIWHERRRDMERSLDSMDQIIAAVPDLEGTLDLTTVVAAGHSYGGLTAQSAGGATTFSRGEPNLPVYEPDVRFKSIVAVSPPGHMLGFVDANSAKTINRPMIVTTGTKDFIPPLIPDWRDHTDTYNDAYPGKKYLAVVDGADHRFGGLICGDVGAVPLSDQLASLSAVTLAFMDYTSRDSQLAKAYLDALARAGQTSSMYAFEIK